jgi:tetratricopeptide (TPR) repeat protein
MNRKTRWTALACTFAVAVMLVVSGVVAFDDQEWADKEYNKAVKDATYGFEELNSMDNDLAKAEPKKAVEHFEAAIDFFEHALTHLANSEVGKEHKGAVTDLTAGNEALTKALDALNEGKVDDAQKYFDKANEYYKLAGEELK